MSPAALCMALTAWAWTCEGPAALRDGSTILGHLWSPSSPTFGSVPVCRVAPAKQPHIPQHPHPTPNRPNPLKQSLNPGELSEAERGSCAVPWLKSALIPERTALIPERGSLPPARPPAELEPIGTGAAMPTGQGHPRCHQGGCGGHWTRGHRAGDAVGPWLSPPRAGQLLARAALGCCPRHRLASAIFKAPV